MRKREFSLRFLFFLLLPSLLLAKTFSPEKRKVLYLMHQGKTEEAITAYEKIVSLEKKEDFSLLEQIALTLLEQGMLSTKEEVRLLSTLGAGFSEHERALSFLQKSLVSKSPELQLIALHFLAKTPCKESDFLLTEALHSDFLMTRLEAAFALSQRKHPKAFSYIENLMQRLPPFCKVWFPSLLALSESPDSILLLQSLLQDRNPFVCVEVIHNITLFGRDDFLPLLRKKITHDNVAEKEACAFALGVLQDSSSFPFLEKLAQKHAEENVRLAANKALYKLGKEEAKVAIEKAAKAKHLFSISALKDISGTEDTLLSLVFSKNREVAMNAALVLLEKKDERALPFLLSFFEEEEAFLLVPTTSLGKAHFAYKFFAKESIKNEQELSFLESLSFHIKVDMIQKASLFPREDSFISLAKLLFTKEKNSFIPTAVRILKGLKTEKAVALLKEGSQKWGFPLLRNYCNLALFELEEEGPYKEEVQRWVQENKDIFIIEMRPYLPSIERGFLSKYTLSAKEKSELLMESIAVLASKKDEASIRVLLEMMKNPESKNRFALAGILLHSL